MIRLENVSKRFQNHDGTPFDAVRPLTLEIEQGEIFGLMGYSGAGKSTLLRLINLLECPDTGSVWVDNQNLTELSAEKLRKARRNIGMVFQQFNLLSNRTVAENVAFPLELTDMPKDKIHQRVNECLEVVQLQDRANQYPARLSGGQKQRVGIARALAPNPHVILADEPTSALDPETTRSILKCLQEINQKFKVTIVIVTHEIDVLKNICSRAALLNHGELLEVINISNKQMHATSKIGQKLIGEGGE